MIVRVVLIVAALLGMASHTMAQELARVHISSFDGSEPITVNSTLNPSLFTLGPGVASIELTAVNPAFSSKSDEGPATYQPVLTPDNGFPGDVPGYIQLTITPTVGETLTYNDITYTTAAVFTSNPSSLNLQTSDDGFTTSLTTIDMSSQATETVGLGFSSGAPVQFRWEAGNDFGSNGGGRAGFVADDIVINMSAGSGGSAAPIPVLNFWALAALALLLAGAGLYRQRSAG